MSVTRFDFVFSLSLVKDCTLNPTYQERRTIVGEKRSDGRKEQRVNTRYSKSFVTLYSQK